MIIKHMHSSGKWNRSASSLATAARRYNEVANLRTYTEVDQEKREQALRDAGGENSGLVSGDHGGRNDAVISFDKTVFKLIRSDMIKVPKSEFVRPNGKKSAALYGTLAVFESIKEPHKRFAVMVAHLSSSVEDDFHHHKKTQRTRSWLHSFSYLKKHLVWAHEKYACDASFFVADYNLNFKSKWVRAMIKTLAPSFKSTWGAPNISGGTHGKRIIDATLGHGRYRLHKKPHLFEDDDSSDHRPFYEEISV